ncbi:MAG TPA: hypothetical protein VKV57_07260 [bacterium]|nr:hypothetical protein [bacterium]
MAERTPSGQARRRSAAVQWKYLIFWLLLFGTLFFISLYGIVAEA